MKSNPDIGAKLWNLCRVLRDDEITYHQYVTELTWLLFLKMAKETDVESQRPSSGATSPMRSERRGLMPETEVAG